MVRRFDPILGMNVAGEGWQGGALDAKTMRDRMSKAIDLIMERADWRRGLSPDAQEFVEDMVHRTATAIDGTFLPTLKQVRFAESIAQGTLTDWNGYGYKPRERF